MTWLQFCGVLSSVVSRCLELLPRRVIDLFACWWSSRRPRSAAVWKMASICLFWCLWRERNDRCLEDLESTLEEILFSFYLCTFGLRLMSTLCLLIRCFFVYSQCTKGRLTLYLWDWFLTYIKKKCLGTHSNFIDLPTQFEGKFCSFLSMQTLQQ